MTIDEHLNQWRRQVLSVAPLSERIETLRKLEKLCGEISWNQNATQHEWYDDLFQHEAERLSEIENILQTLQCADPSSENRLKELEKEIVLFLPNHRGITGVRNKIDNTKKEFDRLRAENALKEEQNALKELKETFKHRQKSSFPDNRELQVLESIRCKLRNAHWTLKDAIQFTFEVEKSINKWTDERREIKEKKEYDELCVSFDKRVQNSHSWNQEERTLDEILYKLRIRQWTFVVPNELVAKVENRLKEIEEIQLREISELLQGQEGTLKDREKRLEGINNALLCKTWKYSDPNYLIETVEKHLRSVRELIYENSNHSIFTKILNDLKDVSPESHWNTLEMFDTFESVNNKWIERAKNHVVPDDLRVKYEELLQRKKLLYSKKVRISRLVTTVIISVLIISITGIVREYLYRKHLAANFIHFVDQKEVLKAEEQCRLIERKRRSIMNKWHWIVKKGTRARSSA